MTKLIITITDEEHDKLLKLSAARGRPPEECIRTFIQSCQPGGSGWQHPMNAKVHEPKMGK